MAVFENLVGKRFGRIEVIKRQPNRGKKTAYLIHCKCGQKKIMVAHTIKTHKGCGCLRLERCLKGVRKTETNPKILAVRKRRRDRQNRDNWLKRRAGTSLSEFKAKKRKQKGKCAICRIRKATDADHDHKKNKPRAILCGFCNRGLGFFSDSISLLKRAVRYLENYL